MDEKPATQADLDNLERRIVEKLTKIIRDSETRLLTEFHKWAAPSDLRQKSHAAALRALDLEMEAQAERIAKLEARP